MMDETPFISCKAMSQKLRIPKTTCLCILHEDLGFRKWLLRWIPHLISENEAQYRAAFFEDLLQVARRAKETNFEYLLTDDESWFYYEYRHDSAWAPSRSTPSTRKAQKIQTKKMPGFHYLVDVRHLHLPVCRLLQSQWMTRSNPTATKPAAHPMR
jgi:hypothetical protein